MGSKEAIEKLSKYNNHYVKDKEYLFIDIESEEWKAILNDLRMLEELKNPYDEYENEYYKCQREAYYNENLGELCFGYSIFEWKGEYIERHIPILKKPMKFKKWEEIYHAGTCLEKYELNDKFIQDHVKLLKTLKGETK